MAVALNQFVGCLVKNELLAWAEVEGLLAAWPRAARIRWLRWDDNRGDAEKLAEVLLHRGRLTESQIKRYWQYGSLRIGDYLVLDKFGPGQAPYIGRHVRRGDAVLIRPLLITNEDPDAAHRLELAIAALPRLEHPNLATFHEAVHQDRYIYFVTEYVGPTDLEEQVRRHGPLPPATAADFVAQAARGLACAHAHDTVHRRLAPDCLAVTVNGTVKVLGLGTAALEAALQSQQVLPAMVPGYLDYLAPEVLTNYRAGEPATDVYGLGCCLHFLVTGRRVFEAHPSGVARLLAILTKDIPPLRESHAEVPEAVDALCQRMVARKPADRPALAEVIAVLAGEPGA
jgi:serine/threonine protein kinase